MRVVELYNKASNYVINWKQSQYDYSFIACE
jgi:hypothetical protein